LFYGVDYQGGANGVGEIFYVDPSAGTIVDLYDFSGPDGSEPYTLIPSATAGKYYGTGYTGGASGYGTLFKFEL
jgi:hypothetical protein